MKAVCALPTCGKTFEAKRKTAQYCGATCRQRAHRSPDITATAGSPPRASTTLVDAVHAELEAAGRLDTALGRQALTLAERLGVPDTGTATAALSKELRATMAEVLAGAATAADELDELAQRRARKACGA